MKHEYKEKKLKSAFSLIELAIVLVIISLVVGGVMGGVEMRESAKIDKVIADYQKYQNAYDMFVKQYNAVPGDMGDAATTFKPFAGGTVTNGNGNELIDASIESANVFAHLSLAGFTNEELNINGVDEADVNEVVNLDTIFPSGPHETGGYYMASPMMFFWGNAGYMALSLAVDTMDITTIGGKYDNSLANSNSLLYFSFSNAALIIRSTEAYEIDKKIDDGLYAEGAVTGLGGSISGAGSGIKCGNIVDGSYLVSDDALRCIMIFNLEKHQGAH